MLQNEASLQLIAIESMPLNKMSQLIASRTRNNTTSSKSMSRGRGGVPTSSQQMGASSSLTPSSNYDSRMPRNYDSCTPRLGASTTTSVPIEGQQTLSRVMASNHQSPSPSRALGRRATQERVIIELELEVEELRVKCKTYEVTVNELRLEMAKMASKGTSKMTLRKNLEWNEVDSTYSLGIGKYCKEWLFPCFKFIHETWMDYSESRKGLPRIIFQYCPIPAGATKVDMWNRVVAQMIAKKYTNMRCNINNEVKKAFKGESICIVYFLDYIYH